MKLLFLLLLSFSLSAAGFSNNGGVDGGGGNAVVCTNSSGDIQSVRMLDLYESEILHGLKYDSLSVSIESKLEDVLIGIYGLKEAPQQIKKFKDIYNNFKMLPEGIRLREIDDSGHIFIPQACKIKQVANFYNSTNVYIVSDFYDKMSDLDKLALILHEGIYLKERENNIKNSKYTRRVVGKVLSKNFSNVPFLEGIDTQKDVYCSTSIMPGLELDHKKETAFWLTNNETRIQFTKIVGHNVYSRKYIDVNFGENTFPIYQDSTPNFNRTIHIAATPKSLIDDKDVVAVAISNGVVNVGGFDKFMVINYKGFDPKDEHDYRMFNCRK